MADDRLRVFALDSSRDLGARIAARAGVELSPHEERDFEYGEHKSRPLVSVRGCDVFVVHSLHGDEQQSANDKLCRLLFFAGALRDASAARITTVVPYLCYSRKDRKTKPRDPVTTRYVAMLFEAMGIDRVVTIDVHNVAAFQNAFRRTTEHLEARFAFIDHLWPVIQGRGLVVVSPDAGGTKRADRFREALTARTGDQVPMAFLEKHRSEGVVSGDAVVGDVEGRVAIIVDDLISSGTTMAKAAMACRRKGATAVYAVATHGVFTPAAAEVLADPAFDRVIVADTVPVTGPDQPGSGMKVDVVDVSGLIGDAVLRLHRDESLVELLEVRR